jgi:hypothetical protein
VIEAENIRQNIEWTVSRTLAKINYQTKQQKSLTFDNETDLL